MRSSSVVPRFELASAILALGLLSIPVWGAATLTLPAANPAGTPPSTLAGGILTSINSIASCNVGGGNTAGPCVDTAFVSSTLATTDSYFLPGQFNGTPPPQAGAKPLVSAFNTWNNANGNNWKLVVGGALDVTITVTQFSATPVTPNSGGMTIAASVEYNAPAAGAGTDAAPNLDQLVWTQVTYDNYFPPSTPAAPATLLDSYKNNGGTGGPPPDPPAVKTPFNQACVPLPVAPEAGKPATIPAGGAGAGRAYCDPIYPFQDGTAKFFDQPTGPWSVPASFRAIALLSSIGVDAQGKTVLTVYNNGINYGFDLKTPEPGFQIVLALLCAVLIATRARRRAASKISQT